MCQEHRRLAGPTPAETPRGSLHASPRRCPRHVLLSYRACVSNVQDQPRPRAVGCILMLGSAAVPRSYVLVSPAYLCGTHRDAQFALFTSTTAPSDRTTIPGFVTRGIETLHLSPEFSARALSAWNSPTWDCFDRRSVAARIALDSVAQGWRACQVFWPSHPRISNKDTTKSVSRAFNVVCLTNRR